MTKAIKCGYLLRYKRRLFSRYWREEFIVLYEDSSMAWFKDKSRPDPEGGLVLKEAPELMAMGEYTLRVPHQRPTSLPQGCTVRQVMAFGTANRQKVYWFLAKSEDEINDWMTAISNTLPIPPGLSVYGEADEKTGHIYESIDLEQHQLPPLMSKVSEKQPLELQDHKLQLLLQEQQQQQQQHGSINQPCCFCAATSHGCSGASNTSGIVVPLSQTTTITAASSAVPLSASVGNVSAISNNKNKQMTNMNTSLGDIATGMMLATGFAHWGWGYGLGWNKPDKPAILATGYMDYDDSYNGYGGRDPSSMDPRWSQHGAPHDYQDYDDCHDNDFDMDFGGDFGF